MDKMRGHKNARQCLLNYYIYFCATFVYNLSLIHIWTVMCTTGKTAAWCALISMPLPKPV